LISRAPPRLKKPNLPKEIFTAFSSLNRSGDCPIPAEPTHQHKEIEVKVILLLEDNNVLTLTNIKSIVENFSPIPVTEGGRYSKSIGEVVGLEEEDGNLVSDIVVDNTVFENEADITFSICNGRLRHLGFVLGGIDANEAVSMGYDIDDTLYINFIIDAKTVSLNKKGVTKANSVISQGKVNKTASWSFSSEDGNNILGDNNWGEYGKWHLGVRVGVPVESKSHYAYPFGKNGMLYRSALVAIRQRAGQQNATAIFNAAGTLLKKVDK
jgi:hypothetical protein